METKKIVMGVISVAVAIIVLMSMIPIFTDAGASEDTYTNEGMLYATPLNDESEYTIEWKYETPTTLTVNEDVFDLTAILSGTVYQGFTFLFTDEWMLRYQADSSSILLIKVNEAATTVDTASVSTEKDLTVSISEGAAAITIGTTTYDYVVDSDGLIITNDEDAEYVLKTSTDKAYVLGDSMIYGAGRTGRPFGAGTALSTLGKGSVDDGMTIEISPSSYSVDSSSINSVSVSGHESLYEVTDFSFVLNNGSGTTTTITYNQIFVPHEVTAERSVHASPVESTLIGLIPLLMMVGIMLTAVGLFIAKYRKN